MRLRSRLARILAVLPWAILLLTEPLLAQSVGAPFAAREPKACPSTTAVDRPTRDLATALVVCANERAFGEKLYLVGGLTVEIGGSRKYQEFADSLKTSIDTDAPVFPIRGGLVVYQCDRISRVDPNEGKNCRAYSYPHAVGACWRTTFGEWSCNMQDLNVGMPYKNDIPPPT